MKNQFLLLLLLSYCMPLIVEAQVFGLNNTAQPIWIAMAYEHKPIEAPNGYENQTFWVTEGWLLIKPFSKVQLTTHIGYDKKEGYKSNFHYYAYQSNGDVWKGDKQLLVDPIPDKVVHDVIDFKVNDASNLTYYANNDKLSSLLFKSADTCLKDKCTIEFVNTYVSEPSSNENKPYGTIPSEKRGSLPVSKE